MAAFARVFLIRHGEVDASWHGRLYGALDVPLSEHGRTESARVAERLARIRLAAVVSSGLARTEHAAACLRQPRALERQDDPALRELDRGEWAGLTRATLEQRSPGAFTAWLAAPAERRPPGGESLADLRARVRPRVAHWATANPGAALAIVTHGWVIRVLVCDVLAVSLDLAPRLDVRTGDVIAVDWPIDSRAPPALATFALDAAPPWSQSRGAGQLSE